MNGYDYLEVMRQWKGLQAQSYCASRAKQGDQNFGPATVFVSWALVSTPRELLNALEEYERKKGLDPATTFYWVCNFCIRQLDGKEEDVPRLGEMVAACPRFVMLLEPWDEMATGRFGGNGNCLGRSWCLLELFHAVKSGAELDMALPSGEEARFLAALEEDARAAQNAFAHVDIIKAEAFDPKDKEWILQKVREDVGVTELNR